MINRSSIFIADVAVVLDGLDVGDEATERRIIDLLGLALIEQERPLLKPIGSSPIDDRDSTAIEPPCDPHVPQSYRYIASTVQSELPEAGVAPVLRPREGQMSLTIGSSERDEPRLPLTPLMRTASTRAILSASLSTDICTGIDVQRAVGVIARREPFDRLPVRTIRSVRRGVQLLVDKSAGLAPYFRDQAWLSEWIVRVIGRQRMEIASFTGAPQRGLHRGLRRRRAYRPPPRGTPIVLLTDLGIADPPSLDNAAGPAEWLAFASLARHAGCPVIAFVPYPTDRWPRALSRAMTILQWDRQLTARRASRRVSSRR